MPSSAKLKLGARYPLITQPAVAGATSLAELQLRIYLHGGMGWWMKCKIRVALAGYLLAESKLPAS